jgi:hypothetical protein
VRHTEMGHLKSVVSLGSWIANGDGMNQRPW